MNAQSLFSYLDRYLMIPQIADYGPQGLQVEAGSPTVTRVALAVDTAPDVIVAAAKWQADVLLVHHGVLWRQTERIAGPLGHRVRLLFENHMHLYAAHLALDAHPEVGNNAVLASLLGMEVDSWWCDAMGTKIGVTGSLERSLQELSAEVDSKLQTTSRVLHYGPDPVRRLAIVSGFGADRVAEAKEIGADTLLTGELSHANYYAAADFRVNVIFAGHYATETVGVQALGRHLCEKFDLETCFLDFPTRM